MSIFGNDKKEDLNSIVYKEMQVVDKAIFGSGHGYARYVVVFIDDNQEPFECTSNGYGIDIAVRVYVLVHKNMKHKLGLMDGRIVSVDGKSVINDKHA